ncbi:MAG TPA: LysM peptidoglycan-binding domain-containing protein, partial [Anaerolineae bacterium]|nr:LysM peptidoglycan-binding domain-containing protein [Anaerolineae bacterium]
MKKMVNVLSMLVLVTLLFSVAPAYTLAQEEVVCEQDVVVQADDWLSKIAEKAFGNPLAFQAIADATNAIAATDDSYNRIDDVNVIEPGWKLCIPSGEQAGAALATGERPTIALVVGVQGDA